MTWTTTEVWKCHAERRKYEQVKKKRRRPNSILEDEKQDVRWRDKPERVKMRLYNRRLDRKKRNGPQISW